MFGIYPAHGLVQGLGTCIARYHIISMPKVHASSLKTSSIAEASLEPRFSGGRECLGEERLGLPGQVWEFRFLPSFPSFPSENRSFKNVWEKRLEFPDILLPDIRGLLNFVTPHFEASWVITILFEIITFFQTVASQSFSNCRFPELWDETWEG